MKRLLAALLGVVIMIGSGNIVFPRVAMAEGVSGTFPFGNEGFKGQYFGAGFDYSFTGITQDSLDCNELYLGGPIGGKVSYDMQGLMRATATSARISMTVKIKCPVFCYGKITTPTEVKEFKLCNEVQTYSFEFDAIPSEYSGTVDGIIELSPCGPGYNADADPNVVAVEFAPDSIALEFHITVPAGIQVSAAPSSTPPAERTLRMNGAVYDIEGSPMPYIRMRLTPSYGEPVYTQTNQNGYYDCKLPIPAGQTAAFDVAVEVFFRCWLDTAVEFQGKTERTAFYMTDLADANATADIMTATAVHVDPGAPQYEGADTIAISRALDFQTIPLGYFSADDSGTAEPMSSNIAAVQNLPAYSYVYRELINGLMFGVVNMGERNAMLRRAPLKVELNFPGDNDSNSSHYDIASNVIRLKPEKCTYTDAARYTVLHEFGHFFETSTNQGKSRCGWSGTIAGGDINHAGYLNFHTADSFIEGFATWYAASAQRYGYYVEKKPDVIGPFGSLLSPRKAWQEYGVREEFAVSQVLYKCMDILPLTKFWSALDTDRTNLRKYYLALTDKSLLGGIGDVGELKKKIDQLFLDCDLYDMPFGNGQWDAWEPFYDDNRNNQYDAGEPFCDLIYSGSRTTPLREVDQSKLKLGWPRAVGQQRDTEEETATSQPDSTARNASSIQYSPNSWLVLTGAAVQSVRVAVRPDGQDPWAYVAPVVSGKAYIGLPSGAVSGTIEVSVPGGGTVWTGDVAALNAQFEATLGTETPLAEAAVTDNLLAPAGTIARPVGGSPDAPCVLEIKPVTNTEAAALGESGDEDDPFAADSETGLNIDIEGPAGDTIASLTPTVTIILIIGAVVVGVIVIVAVVLIVVLARKKRKPGTAARPPAPPQPPQPRAPVSPPQGYTGQQMGSVPYQQGRQVLPGGAVYEGQFVNGRFHGRGVMRWLNGQTYSGEWANGVQNGLGVQVDANGRVQYEGIWRDGKPMPK